MKTVVLFDVDGTLVRTGGSGRRALDRAFEQVWGVKDASRGVDFAGKPDLRNFTEVFEARFQRKPSKAELEQAIAAYLACLPEEVERSVSQKAYVVIDGVQALLERLSNREDVRVGLGTGNFQEGARLKLAPSGLNRFFGFGGFGEDGYDRVHILKAGVRRSKARPKDVVIVGDTPIDVHAGREAGYRTAAVTCGFASAASLRAAKPDHLSKDFRSVETWLEFIGIHDDRDD